MFLCRPYLSYLEYLQAFIFQTPLERAQSIKDKGNVFFKEGKYNDAIRCYSEAIDLCPKSETNILSTFFQNRAACHDQLVSKTPVIIKLMGVQLNGPSYPTIMIPAQGYKTKIRITIRTRKFLMKIVQH